MEDKTYVFNFNHRIRVKLEERGFEIMRDHWNEYSQPKDHSTIDYYKARVDDEGYFSLQLHEFVDIFGVRMSNLDLPYDPNFLIDSTELREHTK